MMTMTKKQSHAIRVQRLKSLIMMLDHMLPELNKLDKTSTHLLSMLVMSLHEQLRKLEEFELPKLGE